MTDPKATLPRTDGVDRSSQYRDASNSTLLAQLNANWMQLRTQQRDIDTLRGQLRNSRIKNAVLMAVLGAAAAKGLEWAAIQIWHLLFG